jgi:hypothetical protein
VTFFPLPALGWVRAGGGPPQGYKVTFNTSNLFGAGTGAKVYFELIGQEGSSGERVAGLEDMPAPLPWVLCAVRGQQLRRSAPAHQPPCPACAGIVHTTSQSGQFGRGCSDAFLYPRLPYLGQLLQLRVGNDGAGLFAAW